MSAVKKFYIACALFCKMHTPAILFQTRLVFKPPSLEEYL